MVAAGGIPTAGDRDALGTRGPSGVEGGSVGKAVYAGRFALEGALDVAGRPGAR